MDEAQLELLREIEAELVTIQREQANLAMRTIEAHDKVCQMLNRELARPL